MKLDDGFGVALMGVALALIQPRVTVALAAPEVSSIAEKITVRIERSDQNDHGSGLIIKHSGNTYASGNFSSATSKPRFVSKSPEHDKRTTAVAKLIWL